MDEIIGSPLLAEHDAPKVEANTEKSGTYQPTDEEQKAIRLVERIFEKNKKHRKKYDGKWMDHYKMVRGKQWKEERPSYRNSAVFNIIWRAIQSQVPIETDSRPKFEFLPQEPSDYELSVILNELCEADWDSKNWLMTLVEMIYDKNFYGTAFGGLTYDEDYNDGLGDICFQSHDPFYQFPDPNCYDINDKRCKNYVEAEPVDVDVLKSQYPDKAQFIKPDLQEFYGSDKTNVTTDILKTPVDNLAYTENYNDGYGVEARKALKKTLWIYDDSVTEEKVDTVNDDGSVITEFVSKKKYPKGRKIIVANKVLLEDREGEYDDGKIPKAKLVNYMLPREFWGVGEVENLSDLQVNYNKVWSFVLDVLELMGNPIWIISQDTAIDTDNVYNRNGLILEPASSEGIVQRVEGVQLQPYVMNLIDRIKSDFDEIAGDRDVSRGVNPTGVTAASAIEALQETAQTRQRQKARFLDAFLQQLGQMYVSRVFQFRTVPQVYRLTNNQNVTKYFKFHVEDQPVMNEPQIDPMTGMMGAPTPVMGVDGQPEMQKIVNYSEVGPMGETLAGSERQLPVNGKFDVKVSTGSSLAFDKARRTDQAYQLFDRGLVDPQYVYETLELPNWQAVMTRMQQKAIADQQMQAQLAMQGQPPMPGQGPAPAPGGTPPAA
jgi:hypothetical protein